MTQDRQAGQVVVRMVANVQIVQDCTLPQLVLSVSWELRAACEYAEKGLACMRAQCYGRQACCCQALTTTCQCSYTCSGGCRLARCLQCAGDGWLACRRDGAVRPSAILVQTCLYLVHVGGFFSQLLAVKQIFDAHDQPRFRSAVETRPGLEWLGADGVCVSIHPAMATQHVVAPCVRLFN